MENQRQALQLMSVYMSSPTIKQVRNQIERAAAYIRGDNKAKLFALLDGAIVEATLHKWINNIDKINVTKSSIRFHNRMHQIPDLEELNAYEIYEKILREANIGFSVRILLPYAGGYNFDIDDSSIANEGFSSIGVKVSADRSAFDGFAGFKFIYRSPVLKNSNTEKGGASKRFLSDGFVFCRGEKIYFIGTAEETTFFAYVKQSINPDKNPLEGRMIFECSADDSFIDAKFSLIKRQIPDHTLGSSTKK